MTFNRPTRLSIRRGRLGLPPLLLPFAVLAVSLSLCACAPAPGGSPALQPNPGQVATSGDCPVGPNLAQCERSVSLARSGTARRAIAFAFGQIGKPYSTADRLGLNSYDCSGLVWRSYAEAGIDIGANVSSAIVTPGGPRVEIPMNHAEPGDIVWYPGHVAIALADGNIIEAAKPGTNVRVVSSKYRNFTRAIAISAP
ncbi:MAG: NlpC/P60 family protein [Microthrixaceae bacterium]